MAGTLRHKTQSELRTETSDQLVLHTWLTIGAGPAPGDKQQDQPVRRVMRRRPQKCKQPLIHSLVRQDLAV
ncbi:uncharacterized protein N7483_002443 [Penicillium malachiteum]|uniref:uncharacterized protein n=1 Tax=Penicillium malachiteum TaxID=1324776 RepID=UPI002549C012|nr:uncharacterized protein N7483_002443 [Penicillium malachiteum]KAJ5737318.1 hypothetical protein N7483_002443 [Penicillium malachiteum]